MRQPRLFISCSRADRAFAGKLSDFLRRAYDEVWFDENRYGGDVWWDEILWNIRACDIFIYLVSPDAIRAAYCQAEYAEAIRLNKPVLPLVIRPVTVIPAEFKSLQPLDLTKGINASKVGEVLSALKGLENRLLKVPQAPLAPEPTPTPRVDDEPSRHFKLSWLLILLPLLGLIGLGGWLVPQIALSMTLSRPMIVPSVTAHVPTATSLPATPTRITATLPPTETPLASATRIPSATASPIPTSTNTMTATASSTIPTMTPTITPTLPTSTSTVPPTVTRRVTATKPSVSK